MLHVRDAGLWRVSVELHGRSNKDIPTISFSYTLSLSLHFSSFSVLAVSFATCERPPLLPAPVCATLRRQSRRDSAERAVHLENQRHIRAKIYATTTPTTTTTIPARYTDAKLLANDPVKIAAAQVASRPSLHFDHDSNLKLPRNRAAIPLARCDLYDFCSSSHHASSLSSCFSSSDPGTTTTA